MSTSAKLSCCGKVAAVIIGDDAANDGRASFEKLCTDAKRAFAEFEMTSNSISLQWVDDDGDLITVASDVELQEAVDCMKEHNLPIEFSVIGLAPHQAMEVAPLCEAFEVLKASDDDDAEGVASDTSSNSSESSASSDNPLPVDVTNHPQPRACRGACQGNHHMRGRGGHRAMMMGMRRAFLARCAGGRDYEARAAAGNPAEGHGRCHGHRMRKLKAMMAQTNGAGPQCCEHHRRLFRHRCMRFGHMHGHPGMGERRGKWHRPHHGPPHGPPHGPFHGPSHGPPHGHHHSAPHGPPHDYEHFDVRRRGRRDFGAGHGPSHGPGGHRHHNHHHNHHPPREGSPPRRGRHGRRDDPGAGAGAGWNRFWRQWWNDDHQQAPAQAYA